MGLLQRWLAADGERKAPGPGNDFWYEPVGQISAAGTRITAETALTVPAVRRSVAVLAGAIASLPLKVHERTPDGKQEVPDHPLYDVLHLRPNEWQSSYTWRETMVANLVLGNRAYSQIWPGRRGAVDRLEPIRFDHVETKRLENGRLAFDVDRRNGRRERLLQDEMFFVQGLSLGTLDSLSLLETGRDTIGLAIALTRFVGRQMRNGARLSGVLEHPGELGPETVQDLRQAWQAMFGGVENAGQTAVLEEGMKFRELSQKNTDAQLLELWNFCIQEIARLFGVPTVLLQNADKSSTYASAEQFFQSFVTHSLRPWLVCIEQAINTQLILNPQRYFAEFSVNGLMRANAEARSKFYASGIQWGWLSRNEARALENYNRREGADELLVPLNMQESGEDGARVPATP